MMASSVVGERIRSPVLLALALATVVVSLWPSSASAAQRRCGDLGGLTYEITATGTTCKTARGVARGWLDSGPCFSGCRVRGWRCGAYRPAFAGAEYGFVTCKRRAARVRFKAGT